MNRTASLFVSAVFLVACGASQPAVQSAPSTPPPSAEPAPAPVAEPAPAPAPVVAEDAAMAAATTDAAMATATTDAATPATAVHHADASAGSTAAAHEPVAMAAGEAVFNRVCNRCHHASRTETDGRITGEMRTEAAVRAIVRSGHGRMRALTTTQLSDAELDEVIAYMRTTLHAVR